LSFHLTIGFFIETLLNKNSFSLKNQSIILT